MATGTFLVAGRDARFPKELPHWIGGKEVRGSSGKFVDKVFGATGEVLCRVPMADEGEVDKAVEAARDGFRVWSGMTGEERAAVLMKAAGLVEESHDDLARLEVPPPLPLFPPVPS